MLKSANYGNKYLTITFRCPTKQKKQELALQNKARKA